MQISDIEPKLQLNSSLEQTIKDAITQVFQKFDWWKLVQEEVQKHVLYIVDNVKTLGIPFKNAYEALEKFELIKRNVMGRTISTEVPSMIFSHRLTEETYQSNVNVVKSVLHLQDWTMPNECDVEICRKLLEQITHLQAMGIFALLEQNHKNSSEVLSV